MQVDNKAPTSVNVSGSKAERYVDAFLKPIETAAKSLRVYVKGNDGKGGIPPESMKKIITAAKLATAVLFAFSNPLAVIGSAAVGILVQSFSADQVERIKKILLDVNDAVPTSVKVLAAAIVYKSLPVLFPVAVGFSVGLELGVYVSPKGLGKTLDRGINAAQDAKKALDNDVKAQEENA